MKTINLTIIVLVFVNLAMTDFALGEKAPEKEGLMSQVQRLNKSYIDKYYTEAEMGLYAEPLIIEQPIGPMILGRQELQARIAQFIAAETALVIPTAETVKQNPDFVEATVKDLNIMCRIFDKELKISDRVRELYDLALFSDSFEDFFDYHGNLGQAGRRTRGIYLDGYGALFQIVVNFPLSAPPQVEEQEKQIDEPGDPVWKQTERELYSPEELKKREKKADPAKEYDAEKVEDLKRRIVKTLKHAANIKSLKTDESVIISVKGYHCAENPTKVLIIRANKSDLNALAKGELDFDKFSQKVQMLMY